MERVEIKGEVTTTKYKAVDGTMFTDQKQCELYENTAKCVIRSRIKIVNETNAWKVGFGYEDDKVEVISGTKENVMMYVGLSIWYNSNNKKKAIEELASFDDNDLYVMWYNVDEQVYAAMSKTKFIERINSELESKIDKQ